MPLFNPPTSGGASGITVDPDGYVSFTGSDGAPMKVVFDPPADGLIRAHVLAKHATLGEVSVANSDHDEP